MAGDIHYAKVATLLHCEGANGSTTITDSAPSPKLVAALGDAKISAAKSKFGTASVLFDGSGDYLRVTSGAPTGTGDFCLEMWINPSAVPTGDVMMMMRWLNSNGVNIEITTVGVLGFFIHGPSIHTTGGSLVPIGAWSHLALTRAGSVFRVFLNGVQQLTSTSTVNFSAAALDIGYDASVPARAFAGNIDEIRLTLGAARYTAPFTPPDAAFPDRAPQVSGVVRDSTLNPVSRTLRAHNRATGLVVATTTSDPITGEYVLGVTQPGKVYVVCLDDESGTVENDLILSVTPD